MNERTRSACQTVQPAGHVSTLGRARRPCILFVYIHVDEGRIKQHRLAQSEKRNERQKESQGSVGVEPCFLPMGPKPFKFSARAAPGRAETQPASQRQQNKYRVRGQLPAFRPQHGPSTICLSSCMHPWSAEQTVQWPPIVRRDEETETEVGKRD